jgi:hypothetical protein
VSRGAGSFRLGGASHGLAHAADQFGGRERLGDESVDAKIASHSALAFAQATAAKKDLHLRVDCSHATDEIKSVDEGHVHIRENTFDAVAVLAEELQSVCAISGREAAVTRTVEDELEKLQHAGLILDHQEGLRGSCCGVLGRVDHAGLIGQTLVTVAFGDGDHWFQNNGVIDRSTVRHIEYRASG